MSRSCRTSTSCGACSRPSTERDILHLLDHSLRAEGVQIFIGQESGYQLLDDCSVVTAPYCDRGRYVGVLGVIGPTRMAYERVIPIVDVTAKLLGRALNSAADPQFAGLRAHRCRGFAGLARARTARGIR